MESSIVTQQVIVLLILMVVGYVAAKKGIIDENISDGLSNVLTVIALPALIISSFNVEYTSDILSGILLMIFYSIVLNLITILISRLLFTKYSRDKRAVLIFGTVFSNGGFMGLPLIAELFGQEALLYGSIFMISYHILMWTYGEGIISKEKSDLPLLKKLASNPVLIAIGVGIIVFIINRPFPYVISRSLSLLSGMTLPLSMLILGDKISKIKISEIIKDKDMYYGCFAKLIIAPLVALIFFKIINAPEILRNTAVFMQSLPSAILIVVLAQKHNSDVNLASKFAVVSHILCIASIPLISLFL